MKMMRPVRARLTIICGKQQMLVSAAMVPTVAPGFSQDCRILPALARLLEAVKPGGNAPPVRLDP